MKSRVQRWDLVVGGFASLIAVAGLLISITLGNTSSLGLGDFNRDAQQFMAMLAAMFLTHVAVKAGLRYRRTRQTDHSTCGWSFERLLNPPRRRGRGCTRPWPPGQCLSPYIASKRGCSVVPTESGILAVWGLYVNWNDGFG